MEPPNFPDVGAGHGSGCHQISSIKFSGMEGGVPICGHKFWHAGVYCGFHLTLESSIYGFMVTQKF